MPLLDILTQALQVRCREDWAAVQQGVFLAVFTWTGFALIALIIEELSYLSPSARTAMLWAVAATGTAVFAWRSVPPCSGFWAHFPRNPMR